MCSAHHRFRIGSTGTGTANPYALDVACASADSEFRMSVAPDRNNNNAIYNIDSVVKISYGKKYMLRTTENDM